MCFIYVSIVLTCQLIKTAGTGVYTFEVHGQIYHKLDQLKSGRKGPRHMQLHFYDTDQSIANRIRRSPHLEERMIKHILEKILEKGNPYVLTFRSLGELQNLDNYKIELNTSISVDQRRFNAPVMEQVAAIWEEGTDEQRRFTRNIMVYANSGHAHYTKSIYTMSVMILWRILFFTLMVKLDGKINKYYSKRTWLSVFHGRK